MARLEGKQRLSSRNGRLLTIRKVLTSALKLQLMLRRKTSRPSRRRVCRPEKLTDGRHHESTCSSFSIAFLVDSIYSSLAVATRARNTHMAVEAGWPLVKRNPAFGATCNLPRSKGPEGRSWGQLHDGGDRSISHQAKPATNNQPGSLPQRDVHYPHGKRAECSQHLNVTLKPCCCRCSSPRMDAIMHVFLQP